MAKWKWMVPTAVAITCGATAVFYAASYRRATMNNFNDCVGAGYPVSGTYPLQCDANGRIFVKQESDPVREAVRNVVANFGQAMQLVSVNGPAELARQAMWDDYRNLVAPQLLAAWAANPPKAPGRTVSSPWPDHIAIDSLQELGPTEYQITGNVILMTSAGPAGSYAVTTTVAVVDGNWMIASWDAAAG